MKRFHETGKWEDPWFAALPFKAKLAWDYVLSKCDNAGVWAPNTPLADFQIGTKIDWDEFRRLCGNRVRVIRGGKWWIPSFVKFQFGRLSADARVHQSVLRVLDGHGLTEAYRQWYSDVIAIPSESHSNGIAIPSVQVQVQDQGQDQDQGQGGDDRTELVPMPDVLLTEAFKAKWAEYVEYRRKAGMRKLQPVSVQRQWAEMATWGHDAAITSIEATIRNAWQGLFEPKAGNAAKHTNLRHGRADLDGALMR